MRGFSVPGQNRASIAKETSRQYPCRTGGSFCYDISNLLSFISHLPWESIDSLPGDTCYICKKTGIIHDFFNFFRPVTKYPSIGVIAREGCIWAPVFRKNFKNFSGLAHPGMKKVLIPFFCRPRTYAKNPILFSLFFVPSRKFCNFFQNSVIFRLFSEKTRSPTTEVSIGVTARQVAFWPLFFEKNPFFQIPDGIIRKSRMIDATGTLQPLYPKK